MTIQCPQCSVALKVASELVGTRGQCTGCGHKFPIEKQAPDQPFLSTNRLAGWEEDALGLATTIKIEEDVHHPLQELRRGGVSFSKTTILVTAALVIIFSAMLSYLVHDMDHLPTGGQISGWLHRSIAHTPAILLGVASLMEILGRTQRYEHLGRSTSFLLWLSLAIMLLSVISGAFIHVARFSWPGRHMIASLAAGVVTLAALMVRQGSATRPTGPSASYWVLLVSALVITVFSTASGLALSHPRVP